MIIDFNTGNGSDPIIKLQILESNIFWETNTRGSITWVAGIAAKIAETFCNYRLESVAYDRDALNKIDNMFTVRVVLTKKA